MHWLICKANSLLYFIFTSHSRNKDNADSIATRLRIWLPIKQSKEGTKLLSLVVIDSIETMVHYQTKS